ncbi:predicted protein [Histoplasma capsulatum G186AR]|uniref:Uncharacterized protein n=1 Tax=Ajellomyces capsulatus (strain G186AR / H82 / ATCC MYA-2454 / RMSCC 2432) TaxID=447093 RepID=C0NB17_AJECG|nr:uncharacterized protein HCBG_00313 [Histoplasma capsulatum G186AR]EEH10858.1 predicted protein [Histoplasma capsulatum G186AR]
MDRRDDLFDDRRRLELDAATTRFLTGAVIIWVKVLVSNDDRESWYLVKGQWVRAIDRLLRERWLGWKVVKTVRCGCDVVRVIYGRGGDKRKKPFYDGSKRRVSSMNSHRHGIKKVCVAVWNGVENNDDEKLFDLRELKERGGAGEATDPPSLWAERDDGGLVGRRGEREREGGAKSKAKPSGYFGRGWKVRQQRQAEPTAKHRQTRHTDARKAADPAYWESHIRDGWPCSCAAEGGGGWRSDGRRWRTMAGGGGDGDGDAIDVRATAWGVEVEVEVEVEEVEISGLACWRVWAMGVAGSGDKRSAKTSGHESVTSGLGSGPDKATQARTEGTRKEGWRLDHKIGMSSAEPGEKERDDRSKEE